MAQGFITSGNHVLHCSGIGIKGGRAFGGVEGGQASAGAGAYVNQTSAASNRVGNGVNRIRDLRQCTLHGGGHLLIFLVDDVGNLQGGKRVQPGGGKVLLLSSESAEGGFAGTHAVKYLSEAPDDCIVESGPDLFDGLR